MVDFKKDEAKAAAATDEKKEKSRIDEDESFWMNRTKSGKGVVIVLNDMAFISSLSNIKEFAADSRKGVKFSLLRPAEEK